MKNDLGINSGRAWALVALFSVGLIAGVSLLFRPQGSNVNEAPDSFTHSGKTMGLTRLDPTLGDPLINEEATLFDPTPLFLPTEWNVGQNAMPGNVMRDSGGAFENYPPMYSFGVADLMLGFPATVQVPTDIPETLANLNPRQPFIGIGRIEADIAPLSGRGAKVEVISVQDGLLALEITVAADRLTHTLWQPLEFLLAVDAAGLIGPPAILARSDDERLDVFFQEMLAQTLQLGRRLTPGIYRVCVGP